MLLRILIKKMKVVFKVAKTSRKIRSQRLLYETRPIIFLPGPRNSQMVSSLDGIEYHQ